MAGRTFVKPPKRITWRNIKRDRYLLLLILPVIAFFVIFHYYPMYGVVIAFKDFSISLGIMRSPWVGFRYFEQFFESIFFWRILRNTLLLSVYGLLWGFPIPIIFALILNEFTGKFKRFVQSVSYLPHFISIVVVAGIMVNILSPQNGLVNNIIEHMGGQSINFLGDPRYFRTVFITSAIWQGFGWNSIIYLAAMTGIDPGLYEASIVDGANRFQQMRHITLPGIRNTIMILLILSIGNLMNVGFERVLLLYSPRTFETADVISTYVYRAGLLSWQYSFAAAVGLFNSIISVVLLVSCNKLSKRISEVSIW